MALSVVDLYSRVLPRTNCGDCGYPTCIAFASMVVSKKLPLSLCPHLSADTLARYQPELDDQHAAGKWTERDLAADALAWARERAASMDLADMPARIGGELTDTSDGPVLVLPYFNEVIHVRHGGIRRTDGSQLGRWEQVFIFNHMAQGGSIAPTGQWKSLQEIPNTVSKIKSMRAHVEVPLREHFGGRQAELAAAALCMGGTDVTAVTESADLAFRFQPLPQVPVLLMYWEGDRDGGFDAEIKLAFDETITAHLDIESILFLSEHLAQSLIAAKSPQ
ncbi:MAG: Fe-S cluster protein [Desulfatitalea sp. BRH_c12]|nr:MAG: Fe-S cluster protein [Desulfatitalea sp. BRH_c12]